MLDAPYPVTETGPARRTETLDPRPHAVVIGSGFGGLAAAVRLGARGYRVTVLEQLGQAGGRARAFHQDGFTFDAGPTIVTAPYLFEDLWTVCGRRMQDDVTLKRLDPFYRLMFHDGAQMDWNGDAAWMASEVARLSPRDSAGYQRFLQACTRMYRHGYEGLAEEPFSRFTDFLKVIPVMARLRADRSLYRLAARHVEDERLRIALSFHPLFIGGNPMKVTAMYGLIHHLERAFGVHYAMGGTHALVRGLVGLIEGQGGEVRLNAQVSQIMVEGRRATGVMLQSGERVPARIVVSNACAATTYARLLPEVAGKRWSAGRIDRTAFSMSVVVWYFGTRRRYDEVPHHTILFGPRYEGLLDDIFTRKRLAEDFSLYLHRPSASDPSVAPEGCDAFYALAPVPNLLGQTDWRIMAEPYRKRIEAALEQRLLPGLSREIISSRMLTPLDFEQDLGSLHGAAFSIEPRLFQSAWFRPHNVSESVDGLYLVGAGTHPGAGLPGVLCSARILDKVTPHASAFV
jgi:phytoene desaturase